MSFWEERMHVSVNMTTPKFKDYSLEYRHMICNGATKPIDPFFSHLIISLHSANK